MCGRLACGLKPHEIRNCCSYKRSHDDGFVKPDWKNFHNSGKEYKPSYNICPTEVAPVLMSGSHFDSDSRIIAPMIFGLIPTWAKAETTTKYSTINCRIEQLKTSKLYGPLLQKGQRCIVICNGFFEWKKEGKSSRPYFIHAEQEDNILIDDPTTWNLEFDSPSESNGFKPLKLAALFEKQIKEDGTETYSFTVLTKDSSTKMSWMHHRMPAIINTEEQLNIWLDHKQFDGDQALHYLTHFEKVIWYPVATRVNSATIKDISCLNHIMKVDSTNSRGNSNLLMTWLGKRQRNSETTEKEEPNTLKIKKEEPH
ncbi:hypothetical protein RUM43_010307 [Polyplax serrata]|uniref:Abasic site processing protein HMCES n=1 Tax=Polyplax serrata TaxID=468196 RepID=A0AAN8PL73_POLSC